MSTHLGVDLAIAVLLMAYGSPTRMEDLMPYLQGIFEGRPVPQYAVDENTKKYEMVKGISPSNSIIETLVSKLNEILSKDGDFRVYLGNKHWLPSLDDAISKISEDQRDEIIAIPLFPFRSHNVEKSYRVPLEESLTKRNQKVKVTFVNGFEDEALFFNTWVEILSKRVMTQDSKTLFVFSAHSLPTFNQSEDEYRNSFVNTSKKIADSLKIKNYATVFQSQGKYGSKWLEPNIYSIIENLNEEMNRIITVPIGFLYDHLEILYDLDTEFGDKVRDMGIEYGRTELPNFSPTFLLALRNIILDNASIKF